MSSFLSSSPSFLLSSMMPDGVGYPFSHLRSAVLAVSPHSFLPIPSVVNHGAVWEKTLVLHNHCSALPENMGVFSAQLCHKSETAPCELLKEVNSVPTKGSTGQCIGTFPQSDNCSSEQHSCFFCTVGFESFIYTSVLLGEACPLGQYDETVLKSFVSVAGNSGVRLLGMACLQETHAAFYSTCIYLFTCISGGADADFFTHSCSSLCILYLTSLLVLHCASRMSFFQVVFVKFLYYRDHLTGSFAICFFFFPF